MGTIKVNSCSVSTNASYENTELGIAIALNYNEDKTSGALVSINGSMTDKATGGYIGSFNGIRQNSQMSYSFSGITDIKRLNDIEACLQDIESQIASQNES